MAGAAGFVYQLWPRLASVSPYRADAGSEAEVVLSVAGAGMEPGSEAFCRLGGKVLVAGLVRTSSTASCLLPAQKAGNVSLELSLNSVDFMDGYAQLEVVEPILVTKVWPSSGPVKGGTVVAVRGAGFSVHDVQGCLFGLEWGAAMRTSDHEIFCRSPKSSLQSFEDAAPSIVRLGLESSSGSKLAFRCTHFCDFMYHSVMRVEGVVPQRLQAGTGCLLTVVGNGFQQMASTSCKFSGSIDDESNHAFIAFARIASSTLMLCSSPGTRVLGTYTVEVTLNGVDYSTDGWEVIFLKTATVSTVRPSVVSGFGGGSIAVIGSHLAAPRGNGAECVFGGAKVTSPALWVSSSLVECATPHRLKGNVSMELSGFGFPLGANSLVLVFNNLGELYYLAPSTGPARGGTVVTCVGNWRAEGRQALCFVDSRPVEGTVTSSSSITCKIPASTVQSRPVSIEVGFIDGLL